MLRTETLSTSTLEDGSLNPSFQVPKRLRGSRRLGKAAVQMLHPNGGPTQGRCSTKYPNEGRRRTPRTQLGVLKASPHPKASHQGPSSFFAWIRRYTCLGQTWYFRTFRTLSHAHPALLIPFAKRCDACDFCMGSAFGIVPQPVSGTAQPQSR